MKPLLFSICLLLASNSLAGESFYVLVEHSEAKGSLKSDRRVRGRVTFLDGGRAVLEYAIRSNFAQKDGKIRRVRTTLGYFWPVPFYSAWRHGFENTHRIELPGDLVKELRTFYEQQHHTIWYQIHAHSGKRLVQFKGLDKIILTVENGTTIRNLIELAGVENVISWGYSNSNNPSVELNNTITYLKATDFHPYKIPTKFEDQTFGIRGGEDNEYIAINIVPVGNAWCVAIPRLEAAIQRSHSTPINTVALPLPIPSVSVARDADEYQQWSQRPSSHQFFRRARHNIMYRNTPLRDPKTGRSLMGKSLQAFEIAIPDGRDTRPIEKIVEELLESSGKKEDIIALDEYFSNGVSQRGREDRIFPTFLEDCGWVLSKLWFFGKS